MFEDRDQDFEKRVSKARLEYREAQLWNGVVFEEAEWVSVCVCYVDNDGRGW